MNKNALQKRPVTIMLVLVITMFSLVACTQQPNRPPTFTEESTDQDEQEQSTPSDTPPPSMSDDELQLRDDRTEQERTQEQLEILIPDGSYEETASYQYHSGTESIVISYTVQDDILQALSITGVNPHKTSERYINAVNEALQELSVGKHISEVQHLPTQISGSSLTTAAFKEHIAQRTAS